ncbi:hypothetical protein [Prosthecodimorpha hirschii]|uniref:hypothetical protein n=1 Tax=Prosthecodimorpha hirschii TaxID=665126 RepID=UPI001128B357|nr:hypothetical protein [Prosthecomicrobium hirschii]
MSIYEFMQCGVYLVRGEFYACPLCFTRNGFLRLAAPVFSMDQNDHFEFQNKVIMALKGSKKIIEDQDNSRLGPKILPYSWRVIDKEGQYLRLKSYDLKLFTIFTYHKPKSGIGFLADGGDGVSAQEHDLASIIIGLIYKDAP